MRWRLAVLFLYAACFVFGYSHFETIETEDRQFEVTIEGAVENEGKYFVEPGTVLSELFEVTGVQKEGDTRQYSKNQILCDKQHIIIPTDNGNELLSINRADAEELCLLPGVGPVTAANIVAYRQRYGDFTELKELMNVSGIGDKKFGKISGLICL